MTKAELANMAPLDFTILILQDRLNKMYKTDTPIGRKLKEAIAEIQRIKSTGEIRNDNK